MSHPGPARAALLDAVADLVPSADRTLLVVVDGVDGAGKTTFADELAMVMIRRGTQVVRATVDSFHHPRAHRHAEGRTAEAVWSRHFDYAALRAALLDPWRAGRGASYRPAWHDIGTDQHVDAAPLPVPDRGVLLVDGVFAQRPEIDDAWDLRIFLDVPFEVSVPRLARRDGTVADIDHPDQRRYADAQRRYLIECDPRGRADVVVDNADLGRPRLVRPARSR